MTIRPRRKSKDILALNDRNNPLVFKASICYPRDQIIKLCRDNFRSTRQEDLSNYLKGTDDSSYWLTDSQLRICDDSEGGSIMMPPDFCSRVDYSS